MNKNDVEIGSISEVKVNTADWSDSQKERAADLCDKLRPVYKKLKAEHICNMKNIDKVLAMSKDISFIHIRDHVRWNEYKALRPFNTHLKHELLTYITYSSASGTLMYKEKLAKKVNSSHKTVQKIIDELVAAGAFIEMPPHTVKNNDDRIINLRPAVDVVVAFIDYSLSRMINDMKFISAYTKIKMQTEFDSEGRLVV